MNRENQNRELFLDLKTLSKRCCLSVRTLRDYIKGDYPLPHFRVGGKILIYWPDFLAWIEQYRVVGKPIRLNHELDSKVSEFVEDF